MRRSTRTIRLVGAIALWVAGGAPGLAQELEGSWESVTRSRGGIGTTYEFTADGTVCISPGAMVDNVYRLEGDTVTIGSAAPEVPATTMVFDPETERLIQQAPGGKATLPMERVGEPLAGASPVLGTWRRADTELPPLPEGADPRAARTMANFRWTLTEDGRALFRIPFRTDCGEYSVSGSSLTIRAHGRTTEADLRLEGDRMVLIWPQGEEGVFERWPGPAHRAPVDAEADPG